MRVESYNEEVPSWMETTGYTQEEDEKQLMIGHLPHHLSNMGEVM